MVGAAPVCPPERPRSGVSTRKEHVPTRKSGISLYKRYMLISKYVCAFADGCALAGRHGRAHRHRPYQPPSRPSTTQSSLILCIGKLFSDNLMMQAIREMVGAAPVCPPERPRSGVSIRKRHIPHPQRRRPHPQKAHSPCAKETFPCVEMFVHCA